MADVPGVKILADLHHADLAESLELLADRFGWEVYFPMGMDWFDRWYWSFERAVHGDAVARQYLVGVWPDPVDMGDHFTQVDPVHPGRIRKGVTLEQASAPRWDIVLCTLTHNERGFAKFAKEWGGVYGIQVGNAGQVGSVQREGAGWDQTRFVLASTTLKDHGGSPVTVPVPHVVYRQEFSLEDFYPEYPDDTDTVSSFIQCFAENRVFYDNFLQIARDTPDLTWQVFGNYGSAPQDEFAQGNLPTTPAVAEAMRRTRIAWHAKWWSDGYGHVIHNLFATGRPVVGPLGYYVDKIAGPLIEHGVTAFDTAQMTYQDVQDTLRRLRDDDEFYAEIRANAVNRFVQVVDFDEDAERVRGLLEGM